MIYPEEMFTFFRVMDLSSVPFCQHAPLFWLSFAKYIHVLKRLRFDFSPFLTFLPSQRFTAGGHQNILGWGSLPTANCSLSFVLPERERSCCHRLTPTKPPAGCLLCHHFCSSLPFCRLSFLPSSTLVWPWGAQTQTLARPGS